MKSMQRKFGGMMKRSANEADVEAVLAEFKTANEMLDRVRLPIKLHTMPMPS